MRGCTNRPIEATSHELRGRLEIARTGAFFCHNRVRYRTMTDAFTVDVPVRYRDLDPFDHVNNAVYATYLEVARVDYFEAVVDLSVEEFPFVIANLEIDYKQPIKQGDEPEVALWISSLRETSCTMEYEIRVDDDIAATAETTMVHVDPDSKRPSPIPDAVREPIVEYEGLEASA